MVNSKQVLKERGSFSGKNPNEILSQNELKHFDTYMQLKNESCPAENIDFVKAALSVSNDLDRLLP